MHGAAKVAQALHRHLPDGLVVLHHQDRPAFQPGAGVARPQLLLRGGFGGGGQAKVTLVPFSGRL